MTQTGAFLLTVAIELPIVVGGAAFANRRVGARSTAAEIARIAFVALAANAFTHPLLWLADAALAPHLALAPRWAILEVTVALAEGIAYAAAAGLPRGRALALSFGANAASFVAGLIWLATAR